VESSATVPEFTWTLLTLRVACEATVPVPVAAYTNVPFPEMEAPAPLRLKGTVNVIELDGWTTTAPVMFTTFWYPCCTCREPYVCSWPASTAEVDSEKAPITLPDREYTIREPASVSKEPAGKDGQLLESDEYWIATGLDTAQAPARVMLDPGRRDHCVCSQGDAPPKVPAPFHISCDPTSSSSREPGATAPAPYEGMTS